MLGIGAGEIILWLRTLSAFAHSHLRLQGMQCPLVSAETQAYTLEQKQSQTK